MKFRVLIFKEGNMYIVRCPDVLHRPKISAKFYNSIAAYDVDAYTLGEPEFLETKNAVLGHALTAMKKLIVEHCPSILVESRDLEVS